MRPPRSYSMRQARSSRKRGRTEWDSGQSETCCGTSRSRARSSPRTRSRRSGRAPATSRCSSSRTSGSSRRGRSASCCSPTSCPSMFLGPIFGAAADRWSRRWCAAIADVARALAFVSLAFFGSFERDASRSRCSPASAQGSSAPPSWPACRASCRPRGCPRRRRSTARSRTSASRLGPALAGVGLLAGRAPRP